MSVAEIKHTPRYVPEAGYPDIKLKKYAEARKRGGGKRTACFGAKLPMSDLNKAERLAKERGFL